MRVSGLNTWWAPIQAAAPTGVGGTRRDCNCWPVRVESSTTDPWAGSMANGAAHEHGGDDEQNDLEEHKETRSSGEGPHPMVDGARVGWLTSLCELV